MKLRNKKTGQIVRLTIYGINLAIDNQNQPRYYSLSELNEDWEDYEPKEPLIEDEKIRKAVRAWALKCYENHMIFEFDKLMNGFYVFLDNTDRSLAGITFPESVELDLEEREYTIDELCGEEE